MPILLEADRKMQLPKMIKIRQKFSEERIEVVEAEVLKELEQAKIKALIKPDMKIAIAVGSRGMDQIATIVKTVIAFLKKQGTKPFIVPAMGSHGRASAEGQSEVLREYGITEDTMGVPIKSCMEVDVLGYTATGVPASIDKNANAADLIIPINRVKPHTGFRGPIESGICKMMAIGLGKHIGCSRIHQEERAVFSKVLTEIAEIFLEKSNFAFGVAVVENAFDKTMLVKALVKGELIEEEKKMLVLAKKMIPCLLVDKIDILLVEQIGKNISGAGMDPNIIGRHCALKEVEGYTGPKIERIVVLGLTEETHGNATGIGNADFTTKQVYTNIDFESTYANMIAARNPAGARIPIVMDSEQDAIIGAIKCCRGIGKDGPYIVRIQDTLHLGEIWISENMLPMVKSNERIEIMDES